MQQIHVYDLKVILVEDESGSRTLLRQLLRLAGVKTVHALANGSALLRQFEHIDADLLLLGFDLGDQLRGTDLVRYLLRRQRLAQCCRVAFITNQADDALADLPWLQLPCRVLAKPLSVVVLTRLLQETALLLSQARPLLQAVSSGAEPEALRRLIRIRAGQLPAISRDAVRQMQVRVLMDWRYTKEAWALAGRIRDPLLGLELRLELAYQLGDMEALQQQLQLMQQNHQLKRKQSWYLCRFQALQLDELPEDLFAQLRDSQLTPYETNLKAILVYQQQHLVAARTFLENRLGLARDSYQRNAILLMLITLTLLDSLKARSGTAHADWIAAYAGQFNPDLGGLDFRRFHQLIPLAQAVTVNAIDDEIEPALQQFQQQEQQLDVFQLLFLAYIYLRLGREQHAIEQLWRVEVQLASMPMAAERLSVGYFHRILFGYCHADSLLAAETYTQWGLMLNEQKQWYRALKMFWQAQRCQPADSDYLLNLLTQLRLLQLEHYWDQSVTDLIQRLQSQTLAQSQIKQLQVLNVPQVPRRS